MIKTLAPEYQVPLNYRYCRLRKTASVPEPVLFDAEPSPPPPTIPETQVCGVCGVTFRTEQVSPKRKSFGRGMGICPQTTCAINATPDSPIQIVLRFMALHPGQSREALARQLSMSERQIQTYRGRLERYRIRLVALGTYDVRISRLAGYRLMPVNGQPPVDEVWMGDVLVWKRRGS